MDLNSLSSLKYMSLSSYSKAYYSVLTDSALVPEAVRTERSFAFACTTAGKHGFVFYSLLNNFS